jgi:hypothetical protein
MQTCLKAPQKKVTVMEARRDKSGSVIDVELHLLQEISR